MSTHLIFINCVALLLIGFWSNRYITPLPLLNTIIQQWYYNVSIGPKFHHWLLKNDCRKYNSRVATKIRNNLASKILKNNHNLNMLQNKTSTHYTYIIYYIGDFLSNKSVLFNTTNNKPEVVSTRKEEEKNPAGSVNYLWENRS